MLNIKVSDLEAQDNDLVNLQDVTFKICINLDIIEISKFSRVREALIDMKILEDDVIRVIVMNGDSLYGSISFDKETDFGLLD